MKEHGKDWKKLQKALGYSYAELRGLYTTWKDMIDPMLNAVAREKKRKNAAAREEREQAEAEAQKAGNIAATKEELIKAEQPPDVPPA